VPKASLRTLLLVPMLLGFALAGRAFAADAHTGPFVDNRVTAELVAETKTVQPGTTVLVGVKFVVEEHWHVYWINPGEAGLTVKYSWVLPHGWTASDILWPTPVRSELMGSGAYGYEGTFVLPVSVTVPKDAPEGKVQLVVDPFWQVCYEQCILDETPPLALDLVVSRAAPEPSADKSHFDSARSLWPRPLPSGATAELKVVEKGLELHLKGAGPWSAADSELYVFALHEKIETKVNDKVETKLKELLNPSKPQPTRREGETTIVSLPFPKARKAPPARLQGILSVTLPDDRVGFSIDLPVPAVAPVAAPPRESSGAPAPKDAPKDEPAPPPKEEPKPPEPAVAEVSAPPAEKPLALGLAILLAFVGGIILNLMPCVLPVLSIKILGFVSQAQEDPATVRRHGYAFALGVLASFWFLVAVIQAIKAGGTEVGWGFQLQHPAVNAVLAAVMLAVGLNLFGVFEIGTSVMNLAGDAATKIHLSGYSGSFWSGILATAIATPCTAPFMAPAVGYAVAAALLPAFLVFTSLGLGMAAPYVVLTANPRLLKKVPRPGPWMETFKRVLAFPMIFVAAWLVGVVGKQTNLEGVKLVLFGLVSVSVGLWIYGHWGTPERSATVRRVVGYGLALACIAFGSWLGYLACQEKPPAIDEGIDEGGGVGVIGPPSGDWEPWTPRKVQRYLAAGYVVFVDYTADWCQSCKVNERLFLDNDTWWSATKKHQVALLQADFTSEDPTILKSLKSFNLAGVPAYVTYSPKPGSRPVVRIAITTGTVVKDIEMAYVPRSQPPALPPDAAPPATPPNGK
jgi:thiol:disulfide interchange protein DsbD